MANSSTTNPRRDKLSERRIKPFPSKSSSKSHPHTKKLRDYWTLGIIFRGHKEQIARVSNKLKILAKKESVYLVHSEKSKHELVIIEVEPHG